MAPPAKKRCQQFKEEYTEQWPFLKKSRMSPMHAFCTVCNTDFLVSHSGRFDCKTHIGSARHKRNEASSSQVKIASLFKQTESKSEEDHSMKVLRAETRMVEFIANHNLSLATSNHLPELVRAMCPDSSIAKGIRCARTKTTEVVKEMRAIAKEDLIERMKSQAFTISTDGSNDMDRAKLFPLVVRTLSPSGDEVNSELLAVPECEGSATGQKIFDLINSELERHNIPWVNCLSLGSDNANVMTGEKAGVFAFCKQKNEHLFLSGCTLHLVHIAAEKGGDCLPVSASDILTDVYYYFNKSSLRAHNFRAFQELYSADQRKLLKHVPTRWLSIGKCLDRLLNNWESLYAFFKEESKSKTLSKTAKERCDRLVETLRSRSTRLYLMFLRYTNKVFDEFLLSNQSDAPQIFKLQAHSRKLLKQILIRFVKPTAFGGNKDIADVDFTSAYNIKSDSDLMVGEECESFIQSKAKNGLSEGKEKEFYKNVKTYFFTVVTYLKKALPISDANLRHLTVADPDKLTSASFSSVKYFLDKFPVLSSASLDTLREEFSCLQVSISSLPSAERCDTFWGKLAVLKDDTGMCPYENIATFMLGLLTVPHSSAHCERIFSCVRKIKTEDRSSLGHDTLESLLVVKHKGKSSKGSGTYTAADLSRLKSATFKALSSK